MSKPSDIRLDIGFFRNLKTRKLMLAHGSGGLVALLKLWMYAAEYHPDGVLNGLADEDFDALCAPQAEGMRPALLALGWVDEDEDGTLRLHDWDTHQAWIVGGPARSRAASIAAQSKRGQKVVRGASGKRAGRKRNASAAQAPLPSNPNPNPVGGLEAADAADLPASGSSALPPLEETCRRCQRHTLGMGPKRICATCNLATAGEYKDGDPR